MTAVFKNVAPGAPLNRGDVVRIGFAQETSYLARDVSFVTDFGSIWGKLFNIGDMAYPISKNSVARGQTTAVVDLRMTRPVSAAELVNALDNVSGFFVQVASLERLNASQAARAPTSTGAQQRESVRAENIKQEEDESIFHKIAKATGTALNVTKWVSVVLVVAVIILFIKYGKDLLPKAGK